MFIDGNNVIFRMTTFHIHLIILLDIILKYSLFVMLILIAHLISINLFVPRHGEAIGVGGGHRNSVRPCVLVSVRHKAC